MDYKAIIASFGIKFSDEKKTAYTCSQMLHLFIRAKNKNTSLILPSCCEDGELEKFAGFISEHSEAFKDTVKGLGTDFFAGESLISADNKSIYLFVFTQADTPIMVKGIKNKKKDITIMPSFKKVDMDSSLGLGVGPGTLWISLKESDINPICTVVRIKCEKKLDLYIGTGAPITQN